MPCRNHPDVDSGLVACSGCAGTFCPNCLVYLQGAPVCGSCKANTLRDARAGVVTQGLDLASISRRFGALFLDGMMLNILSRLLEVLILVLLGGAAASDSASAIAYLLAFVFIVVLFVAYDTAMVASRGQTLGKMALKVKVVSATGGDVTTGQAFIRAIIKLIPIIPYLPAFFTAEKTGLHDMAAGTRVVRWG